MSDERLTFVAPFYLKILHGNYVHMLPNEPGNAWETFVRRAQRAIATIDTSVVDRLFADRDWRPRLTAAWYCGVKRWRQYADLIGGLLTPSLQCYAGQGYCFALACFADDVSAAHLCRYLDTYLTQPDKEYDQYWATPALMWIDRTTGSSHADKYVRAGGLWDQFVAQQSYSMLTLDECWRSFEQYMSATNATFPPGS